MGLFDKLKNVLFEEEEIEEEVEVAPDNKPYEKVDYEEVREYKPLPDHKEVPAQKEPVFEKVNKEENNFSERELFKSESTFKFPAFDEEEFDASMPKSVEEERKAAPAPDFERRRKEEKRAEYSRFDAPHFKEDAREEKKRFKPSPVISPVYGILDKDYKAEDIVEAEKGSGGVILTNKDLDVESVRAKAFGKLKKDNLDEEKPVIVRETYDIKKENKEENKKEEVKIDDVIISDEPIIDDASKLMEERTKTIDELLKDASDEVIEVEDNNEKDIDLTKEYQAMEDEIDSALDYIDESDEPIKEEVLDDEKDNKRGKHSALENDTLENDLYDLIDSMYDNTEDGE